MAYFENFPVVRYGNTYARNILAKVGFTEEVLKNTYVYYPYEMKSELRPDLLSHYYYNDSNSAWVIFLSNSILDPYYQWYLNNDQFTSFIEKKYGSVVDATIKIHHWEVNWLGDSTQKSVSEYEALTVSFSQGVNLKKYWEPVTSVDDTVIGYKRKKLDYKVETNKHVSLDTTISTDNGFTNDERVTQISGGVITASGFVDFSSDTNLILKNVSGSFSNSLSVVGETSNAVATYDTLTVLSRSFPDLEASYWTAISCFDYEIQENEKRRTINVIDKTFINQVETSLQKAMTNE